MQSPVNKEFRFDINGLRAWAVMLVVLYHFNVPGVSGGFSGVDIFFVISGYLMFGIVAAGLEEGSFSIWQFYLSRAKRILPALVVLCLASLVFGWFLLMPKEYQQLGGQVRESLFFTSNFRFLGEAGYFDVESQQKWLLHTWSLSVEWQFYLILPVLLILIWRFFKSSVALTATIAVLFFLSLISCVIHTGKSQSEAFFLLQFRAWEMLLGALVYQLKLDLSGARVWRRISELLGFALILSSALVFDQYDDWPGWRAMVPVSGAALVLVAGNQRSLFTAPYVAQWLGARSYSIYLWHWPMVVALAYLNHLSHPVWVAAAILASLVIGHLSYTWIENPMRRWLTLIGGNKAAALVIVAVVFVAVAAQGVRRSGVPERLPDSVAWVDAERSNHNPRLKECLAPEESCIYGERPVRVVLIGDSHADSVVTAVRDSLPEGSGGVLFKGASGCLVTFGMKSDKERCQAFNEELERTYADLHPGAPIIVAGRTSEYVNGGVAGGKSYFYFDKPVSRVTEEVLNEFSTRYVDTMCRLAKDREVYLMRPVPEMLVDVPTRIGRSLLFGGLDNVVLSREDYHRRHALVWSLQDEAQKTCGVKILDPLDYLCDSAVCYGNDSSGRPYYRDKDHLSEYGNRVLIPMFKKVFEGDFTPE